MKEIWKDVPNYENLYQVSNFGNIRTVFRYKTIYNYKCKNFIKIPLRQIVLKGSTSKYGYKQVILTKNNKCELKLVHRLVAQAFIPNPNNLPQVNHIDENKHNNCVNNLEWCTSKYNMNYGTLPRRIATNFYKKVNQYDLDDNFIKTWNSIKEANVYYNTSHISECCRGRLKQVKGYIWRYADN